MLEESHIDRALFYINEFETETRIKRLVKNLITNVKLVILVSEKKRGLLDFTFIILLKIWNMRRGSRMFSLTQPKEAIF